ncbi:hypothetical protein H5410_006484 [Solanum commersonii]|uniref:Uncharacterized protein n=1 Tax=Solanum commersonii TaxID=4109 RepID=A0A9J6AAL5_SOLCO|nr:hypothetical protein H5410_006484 [Solanum commersonii]
MVNRTGDQWQKIWDPKKVLATKRTLQRAKINLARKKDTAKKKKVEKQGTDQHGEHEKNDKECK